MERADPNRSRSVLAILALAVLSVTVWAPAWMFSATFSVTFAAAAWSEVLGDLTTTGSSRVLAGKIALRSIAVVAAVVVTLRLFVSRAPVLNSGRRRSAWLLRNPWLAAGLGYLVAHFALGRLVPSGGVLVDATRFASVGWVALTALALVTRAFIASTKWAYRQGKGGNAAAGLLVSAAIGSVLMWATAISAGSSAVEDLRGRVAAAQRRLDVYQQQPRLPSYATAYANASGPSNDYADRTRLAAHSADQDTRDAIFAACFESASPDLLVRARIAANRAVSWDDAEDVVRQSLLDTCLRNKFPGHHPDYFMGVVQKQARTWHKRTCREPLYGDPEEVACPFPLVGHQPSIEDIQLFHSAMCRLNETDRTLIELKYLKGLSHREIAVRMNSTEESMRHRVRDAVNRFKAEISRLCPDYRP